MDPPLKLKQNHRDFYFPNCRNNYILHLLVSKTSNRQRTKPNVLQRLVPKLMVPDKPKQPPPYLRDPQTANCTPPAKPLNFH